MAMIKTIIVSDIHGHTPVIPPCELLIIAGDIVDVNGKRNQLKVWKKRIIPWLKSVPADNIIFIAGNHDWALENRQYAIKIMDILHDEVPHAVYLQDSWCRYKGINFWGTPWSCKYGDWAFMKEDMDLKEEYDKISEDTHVLISHCPVNNILDTNWRGMSTGSISLGFSLAKMPEVKTLICGHIHESRGHVKVGDIDFINASNVGLSMHPYDKLFICDMDSDGSIHNIEERSC